MVAIDSSQHAAPRRGMAAPKEVLKGTPLPLAVKFYLIAVLVPIAFNAGPIYMTGIRLILIVMIVPLFFKLVSGKLGKIHAVDYCFILHVGWMAVAFAVNNPDIVIQNIGSTAVEFLGGYLLARAYIRDRQSFVTLCRWLSIMAVITLPTALYEAQTGRPILVEYIRRIPGITSEAIVTIEGRMGLERVQNMFAHPIHYGLFCSVGFSLTFVALEGLIPTGRRIILAVLIGIATFTALSSGALLALALQIGLIAWYTVLRKVDSRWLILFGLFILAYIIIDIFSSRTPIRVFMSYATFSAHNAYWRSIIFEWGVKNILGDATNNIPAAPWFGIGMNDWIRPHYMFSGSMDNFWLVIAVRYGLPGFALLMVPYMITIWKIGRRDFRGDQRMEKFRRAWVFTFSGLTFTLVTVHVWTTIYSFVFFMFGAGIWMLTEAKQTGTTPSDEDPPDPDASETSRYSRFAPRPGTNPAWSGQRPATARKGLARA